MELAALPRVTAGDLLLVHRPGAVQSQLRLSAQAVPRTDPRYPALQLANLAFGGYFSSRLVENIREDKGYTYHARSGIEFTPSGATLLIDADTASEVTAAALWEVRYELGRFGLVPPKESEVDGRAAVRDRLAADVHVLAGRARVAAGRAGRRSAWPPSGCASTRRGWPA